MKIKKKIFIFLIFYFSFFEIISSAKANTKIIVKINSELITSYDIKNKIITSLIISNQEINQRNINDLKPKALESLIQSRLKKIELDKYNLKDETAQVNAYLGSISSNNIENFKKLFLKNKLDYQSFIDEINIEFKWKRLIFNRYSKKIEIDENEIKNEIMKNINSKENSFEYNLSEIEILSTEKGLDEKKINEIKIEIKNSGFEEAVKKFSISSTANNNGKLGWVKSDSLSTTYKKKLKGIKIGQITSPIKAQNKIILLKLNDKKNLRLSEKEIEIIKKEIINKKKEELFNLYSNSLISKLKSDNFIEYYK